MDLDYARRLLVEGNARERLEAARELARRGSTGDMQVIEAALRQERTAYVRNALIQAQRRIRGVPRRTEPAIDADQAAVDDVYAKAIEDTTGLLIHEISPIVGALRTYAELETQSFEQSQVRHQLDQLAALLESIQSLNRAATAPILSEFNLAELIGEIVSDILIESAEVELAGPDPLLITSDRGLVRIVVKSGIVNATEASLAFADSPPPVVVRWDDTDRDYWIAVLDRGAGLPPTSSSIFEIGVSGKRGHLGMGLSLASRAARSLDGKVSLTPRTGGGTQYLFRWPKPNQGA